VGHQRDLGRRPARGGGTEQTAKDMLQRVRARIKALDASGRESMATFERGVGDVAITYENELLLRLRKGARTTS